MSVLEINQPHLTGGQKHALPAPVASPKCRAIGLRPAPSDWACAEGLALKGWGAR
jgi:hypothetical protein